MPKERPIARMHMRMRAHVNLKMTTSLARLRPRRVLFFVRWSMIRELSKGLTAWIADACIRGCILLRSRSPLHPRDNTHGKRFFQLRLIVILAPRIKFKRISSNTTNHSSQNSIYFGSSHVSPVHEKAYNCPRIIKCSIAAHKCCWLTRHMCIKKRGFLAQLLGLLARVI